MACHPLIVLLRERTVAGDFGTPHQLVANLGFRVDAPPTDRLLAPELGGGVLLDMGVYPLTLAHLFLGEPESVEAVGTLSGPGGDSGVDLDLSVSQRYAGGAVASLQSSMTSHLPRTAAIGFNEGRLDFPPGFHHPRSVTWTPYDGRRAGEPVSIEPPAPVLGSGLGNEAAEVIRCLRAGELESPLVPHAQTLSVMRQMDAIRAKLGVVYPGEG